MFETKISSNINHGRFARFEEIKDECELVDYVNGDGNIAGISVSTDGKEAYVHRDDGFYIVVGGTGSKKTRNVVAPYIINNALAGNSMIITDVKGDLYRNLSKLLNKQGYNVIVLNFNCPEKGATYNPMKPLYTAYKKGEFDKVNRGLSNIGDMIFDSLRSEKDPYWTTTSSAYFVGCMLTLFELFGENQATIANALNLHLQGEKKMGSNTYMKEYFDDLQNTEAWKMLSATVNAPNETRASVESVYISALNKLIGQNQSLIKMMSNSSFKAEDLLKEKTAVFIIANEVSLSVHSGLITAIIQQWYDIFVDLADENGGTLERNIAFILDEFGNFPPVLDFQTKVSLSRSRGIYWMIVVQSFAQLDYRYGKDVARTIIGNTANWIYLFSPDPELLKYVSELTGEIIDETGKKRNLLSVNQLRHFQKSNDEGRTECLMLLGRMNPFVTYLPDISEYYGVEPIEKLDIPVREDKEVDDIDFCSIVEEKKKRLLHKMIIDKENKERKLREEILKKKEEQRKSDPNQLSDIMNNVIGELIGGRE